MVSPTQNQRSYVAITQDIPYCFACGRDQWQKPLWYHAYWRLERAHIAAGRSKMLRIEDRRAIVVLCPICHRAHGTNGGAPRVICGILVPCLSNGAALFLKRLRDPFWWDPEWLESHWIGRLPELVEPDAWFMEQYQERVRT